ncbi:hypothetical protein PRECH8_18050 [Insulibacter thermoxylanivorax]|uniref:Uncharacterized protein n=1 Tax=Insulibacter thermoxylanivorax TaxID=2749268 RepID=A0A916VGA1_9BACL|nr:hypothetical protein [Insulibacter thermoxylanivorax]GFR38509.1 hypothetical protein PRECH8_18050 [Insulibacter thermoxylanivorax]
MRCGERKYRVIHECGDERKVVVVTARTPAEARKKFRMTYGSEGQIISVTRV